MISDDLSGAPRESTVPVTRGSPTSAGVRSRPLTLMLGLLSLWSAAGCGESRPDVYPVKGRVVFSDGTPARLGKVEFQSQQHPLTAVGTIQQDGSFVLGTFASDDGACAGEHAVIVMQLIVVDTAIKHEKDHGDPIDPKFGSYASSPLRATVKPDASNEIVLTVEKAARQ